MIPLTPGRLRTYYDPNLWIRLEPGILEEYQSRVAGVLAGKSTLEDYREAVGYLKGLNFVMNLANDLCKVEDDKRDDC